jgi:tritrans,polycis-undecaprenyl-diphosphate synthase [geranylgeranyl-diphosphate specific]
LEEKLIMDETRVPKHIGIVMDGNRRLARKLMMKPWMGHEWGAKKVEKMFDWCKELGIRELTLYTFSIQNFNRPKEEFDYLMQIFIDNFTKLLNDDRLRKDGIRVNFIGRTWLFPEQVKDKMSELMEMTKDYTNYQVNFAMAYGGREEVIDAVKKIAEQVQQGRLTIEEINEKSFSDCLYMKDEPELIIRTGGEKRTSNFLSYQSAYSEWIFLDKMWPEFERADLEDAICEYRRRERRFGK